MKMHEKTSKKIKRVSYGSYLAESTIWPRTVDGARLKIIDLRSDTVTRPTPEMRRAMADDDGGDDEYYDAPTTKRLQEKAAEMTGKEAALFVTSGTLGNLIAVWVHTERRGTILMDRNSHIYTLENSTYAHLLNVSSIPVDAISRDIIIANAQRENLYRQPVSLIWVENPSNKGKVYPLKDMEDNYDASKSMGLRVHIDGARIFNAACVLGVDVKEITQYSDSVMFCLSKGLCSPFGSILCGNRELIKDARHYRKMLGGGMRQSGILAASGLISLRDMPKRLHIDHENARYLRNSLSKLPHIQVDYVNSDINMVFFKIALDGFAHGKFVHHLSDRGIIINERNPSNGDHYRMVTHHDVSKEDIDYVLQVIERFMSCEPVADAHPKSA
jgi:threonine aldolase